MDIGKGVIFVMGAAVLLYGFSDVDNTFTDYGSVQDQMKKFAALEEEE